MSGRRPEHAARRTIEDPSPGDLLEALVNGWCLSAAVPTALELVERDPLASGGCFPGDLVRGLMEVPRGFWGRHPRLYDRYLAARSARVPRRGDGCRRSSA